jgi:hypothetical protein
MLDLLAFGVSFWLVKLEKALTRSRPRGVYVKANEKAIIRSDVKTQIEMIARQVSGGLITQNEGRALLDRQPLTGGDVLWQPRQTALTGGIDEGS